MERSGGPRRPFPGLCLGSTVIVEVEAETFYHMEETFRTCIGRNCPCTRIACRRPGRPPFPDCAFPPRASCRLFLAHSGFACCSSVLLRGRTAAPHLWLRAGGGGSAPPVRAPDPSEERVSRRSCRVCAFPVTAAPVTRQLLVKTSITGIEEKKIRPRGRGNSVRKGGLHILKNTAFRAWGAPLVAADGGQGGCREWGTLLSGEAAGFPEAECQS